MSLGKSTIEASAKKETKDNGPTPHKGLSAYNVFNSEFVKEYREAHPETKVTEIFGLCAQKWKGMDDKARKPYLSKAEADKSRFEKQCAEREKKGFFTLDDKSKSTDPKNAKLFKQKKSKVEDSDSGPEDLRPKRAISGYMFFNMEFGAKLRE